MRKLIKGFPSQVIANSECYYVYEQTNSRLAPATDIFFEDSGIQKYKKFHLICTLLDSVEYHRKT